jgi:hypothetical protein
VSSNRTPEQRYAIDLETRRANLALDEPDDDPDVTSRHASDGNIRPVSHRRPDEVTFDVLRYRTSTSARGFVRYIRIRPDRTYRQWICDDCNTPVSESQFMTHAEDKH